MSASSDLASVELFVRNMRAWGATKVQVGDVCVEFADQQATETHEAPAKMTEDEIKKASEALIYAGSD